MLQERLTSRPPGRILQFPRDLLQALPRRADAEQRDSQRSGHQDDGGDEEDAAESDAGKGVADDDGRGEPADAAEGRGDAHARGPERGRIQLRRVGVDRGVGAVHEERERESREGDRCIRPGLGHQIRGHAPEQHVNHDRPLPIELLGDERGGVVARDLRQVDDDAVAEALGDGHPLLHQQRGDPGEEAVVREGDRDPEDPEHERGARHRAAPERGQVLRERAALSGGDRGHFDAV